jgi:thiol-disulfide isomerase/thioredoxin
MRIVLVTALGTVLAIAAFALDVGKPSPAFTIQKIDGTSVSLTQFKGKVVALAFISTECPHCQNLTRMLNGIAKEYAPKGVQFLECAFNDAAPQTLAGFIQTFQPAFPVGRADRGPVTEYLSWSAVKTLYVPHLVFLDRKGVVRADYPGESDFMKDPEGNVRKQLDELLKPASTTRAAHPQGKSTASATAPSHP